MRAFSRVEGIDIVEAAVHVMASRGRQQQKGEEGNFHLFLGIPKGKGKILFCFPTTPCVVLNSGNT